MFYILVVGARAVMMLVFYPILSKIGYGMKKREAVFKRIPPGLARIVDTDVVAQHVLDVQHELVAEHVHRGVLTPAGAAEVEKDLIADRGALKKARRRKRGAKIDRHIELVRGRGDADTTEGQRDMLDLTMTNAWSATTTASTHRHRGTEELSEI